MSSKENLIKSDNGENVKREKTAMQLMLDWISNEPIVSTQEVTKKIHELLMHEYQTHVHTFNVGIRKGEEDPFFSAKLFMEIYYPTHPLNVKK